MIGCSNQPTKTVSELTHSAIHKNIQTHTESKLPLKTKPTVQSTLPNELIKKNTEQFIDEINQAMKKVKQKTKIPYLFEPTEPNYTPAVTYLGVKEKADSTSYKVWLFNMPNETSLDNPILDKQSNATVIGTFEATLYDNHDDALKTLNQNYAVNKTTLEGTINNSFMKDYLTSEVYNEGEPNQYPRNVIEWNEGKWVIDIFGAASLDLNNNAENVDLYLQRNALPPTDGRIFVYPNLSGSPLTQVSWVYGETLYTCQSWIDSPNSQLLDAIKMAVSMKDY